jgi:DNA-binding HxlR family transcriptional regulator
VLKKTLHKLILSFLLVTNLYAAEVNQDSFNQLIKSLEENLKTYEVTTQTSLLKKNEEIIDKFNEFFKKLPKDQKLEILTNTSKNINDLTANMLLKIVSKDFENQSNLDFLTSSEQLLFSKALAKIIDTSYKSNRNYNDSAYEIAKIIVNSDIKTANNLILVVNQTSLENNNSKNLSSNILYNLSKLNSKKIDELSDDISNELIKQSLNELENDIVIKKTKVKKKIDFENNFSQTPLIAISSSVLSVNKSLTEKIADNIIKSDLKKKDELSFKLAQQTNILDDWQNNENKEIIESKSKFVEKIFPEAFKDINEEKMEFAIEIVLNSDLGTSNKTIEAVVDSYIDNNNNFFKVEKDFFEKMQDVIKATKINNNQFARNAEEAEIILKSFYTDPISPTVLNNPQLAYVYAGLPIEKFEQFSNVSPN